MSDEERALYYEAGYLAGHLSWPDPDVVTPNELAALTPAGDPVIVLCGKDGLATDQARTFAAIHGAGRPGRVVTTVPLPPEVEAWLPASSLHVLGSPISEPPTETSPAPAPSLTDISDDIVDELQSVDALWDIQQQIASGETVPAQLDRLTFSVCRDRAWFTPIGLAHQPRDWSDFPRGSQGNNEEFALTGMTRLRAALSIPIRLDGSVGLGLLMQCEELGTPSRGEFLSGSSERRANAHSNEMPMDYAYHDGFAVELLTDPFEDDGRTPLAPLPLAVSSAPFGQACLS